MAVDLLLLFHLKKRPFEPCSSPKKRALTRTVPANSSTRLKEMARHCCTPPDK